MPSPRFRTPLFITIRRHPLYLGFIIAFGARRPMTIGISYLRRSPQLHHRGILLEERDLNDLSAMTTAATKSCVDAGALAQSA